MNCNLHNVYYACCQTCNNATNEKQAQAIWMPNQSANRSPIQSFLHCEEDQFKMLVELEAPKSVLLRFYFRCEKKADSNVVIDWFLELCKKHDVDIDENDLENAMLLKGQDEN